MLRQAQQPEAETYQVTSLQDISVPLAEFSPLATLENGGDEVRKGLIFRIFFKFDAFFFPFFHEFKKLILDFAES